MNHYDKRYLGIVLSMYTGLRIGELCALTWKDIDLKIGIFLLEKHFKESIFLKVGLKF